MLKYSFRRPCDYLLLQKKNNNQLFHIYFSLTRIAVLTLQKFCGTLNNNRDTRYKKHHNNWQKEISCCKYQILKKCMRWPKYASKGFHPSCSRSDNFTHDAFYWYSQSTVKLCSQHYIANNFLLWKASHVRWDPYLLLLNLPLSSEQTCRLTWKKSRNLSQKTLIIAIILEHWW